MLTPPSADLSKIEDMAAVWPDPSDREFASRLWREYIVPRSEAVREAEEGKGALGRLALCVEVLWRVGA